MLETRLKLARFAITTLLSHCYKKDFTTKNRSLIFNWVAFSFDHDAHSLQRCFPQCCFNSLQYLVLMGESDHCTDFSSTSQSFSMGLRSQLCGGQPMCEIDGSCSLNHFHSLSPVNSAVIILEPARAIGDVQD